MRNTRAISVALTSSMVLLVLVCATLVIPGAAVVQPIEQEHMQQPPPVQQSKLKDCLAPLSHIDGCVEDIIHALDTHNLQLSAQCCKAIIGIDKYCWPLVLYVLPLDALPFSPVLPSIIMSFCSAYSPPAPLN
eukprot:TRINITY_DN73224_c0_g1_i1.p1 TRINITY_DN73224_c0_g1~~TRINITY_DN73224_c0_g1_i1.p1  ORF type:complete len:133 (-),score=20.68 TRINITY_DN73224_c0_g1_i1:240-638(-)